METAQINSPRFNYQAATPASPQTLDDMRMVHGVSATEGNFSAKKSMKPVLLTVLVVAALASAAIGVHRYSENATERAAAATADPSVPAASQVPAIASTPVAPPAPTAKDTPAIDPLTPMTKAEESSSMPRPGQANNHSSESLNPVKAKEAAKPAARVRNVPAQVAPTPAPITATEITPPAREATPPSPPAPPVTEPTVVPPPAPIVEPVPTTPPEPPKQ